MTDLVSLTEGGVLTLRINRPDRSNAITPALATAMTRELEHAAADRQVVAVVLRGTGGRAFCGGYDLGAVGQGVRDDELRGLLDMLLAMPMPTIAHVDGHAVGAGLDLACSCDLRVARKGVKIGLPAVRLGVAYAAEGLWRIVDRVPSARRFLLTGELVLVEDAPGFADDLVEADEMDVRLRERCAQLRAASPSALQYMVALLRPGMRWTGAEAARRWRDEILDGPDVAAAAKAREEGTDPVFMPRRVPPGQLGPSHVVP